jgi:DNA-binding Lrp family transcriptional regulator
VAVFDISTVLTVRSDSFDGFDRQLVHALQLDARAPFSRIANVLGVSDQTVARRYTRLRSKGALRVRGLTDPYLHGTAPWLLRIRCAPAGAPQVAEALARRDDTAWVRLTSGGTEIACMVINHTGGTESLLLDRLPRTPRVESVTAHHLLSTFSRGLHNVIAEHSDLAPDQVRALQPDEPLVIDRQMTLDERDRLLLDSLAQDGRAGLPHLSTTTGWSRSTVRRRMTELIRAGILSFDVDVDQRLFPALAAWTQLWLSVEPAFLESVGHTLAEHPEVGFAAATTGPTNVYASVARPNAPALYSYLTARVASLPGIRHLETAPVLRNIKTTTR